MKTKEIIDELLNYSEKRGNNCNNIILDRGTRIDFEFDLIEYYKNIRFGVNETYTLDFYRGYRIVEYHGTDKIYIKIE